MILQLSVSHKINLSDLCISSTIIPTNKDFIKQYKK